MNLVKKLWRNYFWKKNWYKRLILYRFNLLLGRDYLDDGWYSADMTPLKRSELNNIHKM